MSNLISALSSLAKASKSSDEANNLGAIFGGFIIWFTWIEAAPASQFIINIFTSGMEENNPIKNHLLDSIPYFRYLIMGLILLLIMRYRPKGILPEKVRYS